MCLQNQFRSLYATYGDTISLSTGVTATVGQKLLLWTEDVSALFSGDDIS